MTDDRAKEGRVPLEPFPTARADGSPFPPLYDSLPPPPADPPSDWIGTANAHDLPTRENTLAALGRFAFPPAPPLDDEGLAARDRRWTSRVILAVTALLLVFNAASPLDWARQQPPGWVPDTVERLAVVWGEQAAQLGADRPRAVVQDLWAQAEAARFPGQEARAAD